MYICLQTSLYEIDVSCSQLEGIWNTAAMFVSIFILTSAQNNNVTTLKQARGIGWFDLVVVRKWK